MKTNRRVWPADSAACTESEPAELTTCRSSQRGGPFMGQAPTRSPDKQTAEEEGEEDGGGERKTRQQSKLQLEAIEVVGPSKAILSWCWSPYFYWCSVVFTDTSRAHNCEF